SATSPGMARTNPDAASCAAAAPSAAGSRASMTRFQPSAASDRASSNPRPREAPVMIATGMVSLLFASCSCPHNNTSNYLRYFRAEKCRDEVGRSGSALELERAVGDDVLLHLGRARADRGVALP